MLKKMMWTMSLVAIGLVSSFLVATDTVNADVQKTTMTVSRTATPREWQERFWAMRTKTQSIMVDGVGKFVRTTDDLNLLKYKPSELKFWCLHGVNKQTKVLVLPYGTFIKQSGNVGS